MENELHTFYENGLGAPNPHLYDFAQLSTDLLHRSHTGGILLANSSFSPSFSDNTYRLFIDHRNQETPRVYERLAVHLGHASLTVSMEHHHGGEPEAQLFPRSTVVIENGEARVYHSRVVTSGGERVALTHNEDESLALVQRLSHSLSVIGIQASQDKLPLLRAG